MATQIVMDNTGDSRHFFDPANENSVSNARLRFDGLLKQGYTAAIRTGGGTITVTHTFDPKAEETLFYPRLVGG